MFGALGSGKRFIVFHTIVTHERPHVDEIVAIWLLKTFGEEKFPGICTATIEYWACGKSPDGRSAEEYEQGGILCLGIGGGRFDEHPTADAKRKEKECTATLVAKALGIENDRTFERILRYAVNNDLRGATSPLDLAYVVQAYHEQHPDDPEAIIEWATLALDTEYEKQRRFLATEKEFREKAVIDEIPVLDLGGKPLKMVTIESDNEQMGKFARSEHGCGAAIVVQKNRRGNVVILTDHKFGIKLFDVARMVRLAELREKGDTTRTDWDALGSEGKVRGVEEWFFHLKLKALLNGSLTAPDTVPTRIALDEIRKLVRVGLSRLLPPKKIEIATNPTKNS